MSGLYDLRFAIYDTDTSPGTLIAGPVTNAAVPIANGLFTLNLDFGSGVFTGEDRWLEIAVRTNGSSGFSLLDARQRLTAVPYAITAANLVSGGLAAGTYSHALTLNNPGNSFAGNGGGLTNISAITLEGLKAADFWRLDGNNVSGLQFLGTTNNQPLELRVNNTRALRIEPTPVPSLEGGYFQNTTHGVSAAAIVGGGRSSSINEVIGDYGFVGAGHGGKAGGFSAVVDGAYNDALSQFSFIGSGVSNTNRADYSLIGSGGTNYIAANANNSAVLGGAGNQVTNPYSLVSGGQNNLAGGFLTVVVGGSMNMALGPSAGILGGSHNQALGDTSSVIGGFSNVADGQFAIVGGGYKNQASGPGSFVGGGGFDGSNPPGPNIAYAAAGTIGGGVANETLSPYASVLGGAENRAMGEYSFVGGGQTNTASGYCATTAGGYFNNSSGSYSFAGAGFGNQVTNTCATAPGGFGNVAGGVASTASGGKLNLATGSGAVIGGGGFDGVLTAGNRASGASSTVAGGIENSVESNYGSIGGGAANTNSGVAATVAGGWNNLAAGDSSAVAGGVDNSAVGFFTAIGGGVNNIASADYSAIGGGQNNNSGGFGAVISGGEKNIASGSHAVVAGGYSNQVTNDFAVVPGGNGNTAGGVGSLAAGQFAQALHRGSFVWADSQPGAFASSANDQFCLRAQGGVQCSSNTSLYFGTQTRQMINLWGTQYGMGVQNLTTYFRADNASASAGFSWYCGGVHDDRQNNPGGGTELMRLTPLALNVNVPVVSPSDRNLKEDFESINSRDVLEKVAAMPIPRWSYKTDPQTRHLGPMAQDFYAAFSLGTDDKHIATIDESGVALAAIQGLNRKLEEQTRRLEVENAELKQRLFAVEQLILHQR